MMHRRPHGGSRGKNGELPTSYGAPHSYSGGDFGASFGSASDSMGYRSSPSTANFRRHSSKKSSGGSILVWLPWIVVVSVTLFFVASTFHYRGSYKKMQSKYNSAEEERETLQQSYQNLYDTYTNTRRGAASGTTDQKQVNDLMERIRGLERDKRDVVQELTTLKATKGATANADLEAAQEAASKSVEAKYAKREGALRGQIGLLRDYIIRESYREALELFGEGPHKVEFVVELPPIEGETVVEGTDYVEKTFVVQLHSIEKMPHAVHLFLEQVSHGLWNGCSFVINAPHILQAGALPASGDYIKDNKMEAFVSARLATLSFQEYSDDYPHKRYTLGFAGRPGGPDFYINKIDNTANHGPGGQEHHDLEEEADPCFGFVEDEYTAVVDRMSTQPSDSRNSNLLVRPIHIKSAVLKLPNYNDYHEDMHMGTYHENDEVNAAADHAGSEHDEDHPELAHFDDNHPQEHDHLDPDHHLRDHHDDEPPRRVQRTTGDDKVNENVAESAIEADGSATAETGKEEETMT